MYPSFFLVDLYAWELESQKINSAGGSSRKIDLEEEEERGEFKIL